MLDSQTKLFGILGNPLSHSLSPALHKYLLNEISQEGRYHSFEIKKNQLADTINGIKADGFLGFNVTIPYKQTIIPHLSKMDEEAHFIGAVNTVHIQGNKLFGFNTDGQGFISAVKKRSVQPENFSAIVLGAGGAARAVIFNLIRCGVKKLFIFNRTLQRAESLAMEVCKKFPSVGVDSGDSESKTISSAVGSHHLIINATSLGMWPDIRKAPYLFEEDASGWVAIDLIYNPLQTKFLKSAQEAGAKTLDGLDMFIFQGAASLRIWLGFENDIEFNHEQLRNYLSRELKKYGHN